MPRFLRHYNYATPLLVVLLFVLLMSLPGRQKSFLNLLSPTVSAATTFTVNSTGDGSDSNPGDGFCNDGTSSCTLRAAIQETESNGTADAIDFAPALSGQTISLTTNLPAIAQTLTITGPGANSLTIERSLAVIEEFRIFSISSGGGNLTMSGLRIAKGRAFGPGLAGIGGGIRNFGTVIINGCVIAGNSSGDGGGIANRGDMTINNSTIDQNTASGAGGGISNGSGGDQSGILRINNTTISNNTSQSFGGGGIANIATVLITNSTISTNTGANGGGINNANPMRLTNVTIANNTATNAGGGVYNPGIGTISLGNTIIAGNTAPSGPDGSGFNFNSQDYNLIGNTSQVNLIGTSIHNITNVNALLSVLGNNGGPTQTHALLPGSPAIDAANNCVLTNACSPALDAALTTDQRGVSFPRAVDANGDGIATVDIGAYEKRSILVTNTQDSGAGSLRQVITDANSTTDSPIIIFQSGLTGTISLSSVLPNIAASMGIAGPGANTLTVARSTAAGTPNFRIFTINAGQTAAISGLTISNGSEQSGAGILNFGTLTLNACAVTGNTASVAGGALANDGGSGNATANVLNSTISGNAASSFGAGLFSSGFNGVASLNVINSTITDNGNTSFGGGIYSGGDSGNATLNITNSTIAGNSASSSGGGIFHSTNNGTGAFNLRNTIVSDNTIPSAPSNGPDIFNFTGTVSGSNNVIETTTGYVIAGSNNLNVDPRLEKDSSNKPLLKNNGGSTLTLALLIGSPAFDAGDNTLATNVGLNTDQRGPGFDRIVDGPDANLTATVDIGAFEAQVSLSQLADQTINEDGTLSLPFNVGGTTTSTTATSSNTALVPNSPTNISVTNSGSSRTLTINPAANAFGSSTITLTVNGSNSQSMTSTFVLTINSVNDPPSFIRGPNQTVNENDGPQTVNNWATNISPGPNESVQVVNFNITNNTNAALFSVAPAVSSTGTLTYTPATGVSGIATITLVLKDDGGGADTSAPQSFSITVREGGSLAFSSATFSVAENAGPAAITISRTGGSAGTATVLFTASDGTATSTDYIAGSQTITFNDGEINKTVNVPITDDLFKESDETVNLTLSNIGGSGSLGSQTSAVLTVVDNDPAGGYIRFTSATFNTTETSAFTSIFVQRVGDVSQPVTVDYATVDNGVIGPCSTINSLASARCDYSSALGTLRFAANETTKAFNVLISQDNYVEGPESLTLNLTNIKGDANLATPSSATLTIADDQTEPATNPVDEAPIFVRQHYHDFLNREPDLAGLAFWSNQIMQCQQPGATCNAEIRRINVSAAFFLSIEFQETGYLVERLYKTSYGDAAGTSNFGPTHQLPVPIVRLNEFLPDSQEIGRGLVVGSSGWEQVLENNKVAFILQFVQRSRFTTAYPTTMTPAQFVDALFVNTSVTPSGSERTSIINEFGGAGNTADNSARGRALRRVAENQTLNDNEKNRAFVLMQYFGYLRRNPNDPQDTDYTGYDFWLTKLNEHNGNYIEAEMVKAFLDSSEYRARFGP